MHRTLGGEVVSTFVWREAVYSISDGIPEIWDRSRRGGAQQRLEFGECVLNRIEVGRIWREVKEPCAGLLQDNFKHPGRTWRVLVISINRGEYRARVLVSIKKDKANTLSEFGESGSALPAVLGQRVVVDTGD